ncbi:MAG: hypothetical protein ACKVOQ_11560 [Cyclobacteriaceae bacterium]
MDMLTKQIFFPVHQASSPVNLKSYAELFAHYHRKTFSFFFWQDYWCEKDDFFSDSDRTLLEQTIQIEATDLQLKIDFCDRDSSSLSALIQHSCFADVLVIPPTKKKASSLFLSPFMKRFLQDVACPIFMPSRVSPLFNEVLILFDYDWSALAAFKSFIQLFHEVLAGRAVTVILLIAVEENEFFLENHFIHYVKMSVGEVGIIPVNSNRVNEQLIRTTELMKKPVLILGKNAIESICATSVADELRANEVSFFYSNR